MSTQTVTLRLVADNGQLVGTVRASKAEIDGLGRGAQQAGGAAEQGFSRASAAAERTSTFVTRAKQAVAGFALAFASIQGVQAATKIADTYSNISAQVRLATKSQAEYSTAQAEIFAISQRTSTALTSTADLYARITRSTAELGVEQSRILGITETINRTFAISGTSAANQANAITQLTQAFAGGVLRAEEFNSVIENSPRLAQAFADGLGVGIGELRRMVNDGEISVQKMIAALEDQSEAIQAEFAQIPLTIERAWVQIGNAVLSYIGQADQASGASRALAESIALVAANFDAIADTAVTVALAAATVMVARYASGLVKLTADRLRDAAAARQQAAAAAAANAALIRVNRGDAAADRALAATGVASRAAAAGMGLLRGAIGLLGGPVGVAITGVSALAMWMASSEASAEQFARGSDTATRSLEELIVARREAAKGPPLLSEEERSGIVEGQKQVQKLAQAMTVLAQSRALAAAAGKLDQVAGIDAESKKLADEIKRIADNMRELNGAAAAAAGGVNQADEAAKKATESAQEQTAVLARTNALIRAGIEPQRAALQAQLEINKVHPDTIKALIREQAQNKALTESLKASTQAREEETKAREASLQAAIKIEEAERDEQRSVDQQLAAQQELNRLLRAGVEASEAEAQVRRAMEPIRSNELDDSRAKLDIEKQITDTLVGQREATQQALQRQREVEEEAQRERLERAQRAADEISRSLTDALYRGFEDGKNIADNFFDTLENTAKTLVLRPVIEFAVQPLAGVISSVLNGGGLGSALGGGLDTALSLDRFQALGDVFFERGVLPLADILGNAGFEELAVSITNLGSYLPMLTKAIPAAAAAYGVFELARSQRPAGSNVSGTLYGLGALNPMTAPFVGLDAATGGRVFGTKWRTASQKLAIDIVDGILDATIETVQRKKRALGGSNKRRVLTDEAEALDDSLADVFGPTLRAAREATRSLGLEFGDYTVSITESIKGLKGDELNAKIEEIFGNAVDEMVRQAVPVSDVLENMRRDGETLSDTLIRVASETTAIDDAFERLGFRLEKTGAELIEVTQAFADIFGGADAAARALGNYFDRTRSDSEKYNASVGQLDDLTQQLGLDRFIRTYGDLRDVIDPLLAKAPDQLNELERATLGALEKLTALTDQVVDLANIPAELAALSLQEIDRIMSRREGLAGERSQQAARTDMFLRLDDDSERVKANFEAAVESSREVLNLYARGFSDADGLVKQAKARILADIRKQEQGRQVTLDFFAQQVSDASETLRAAVLRAAESVTVVDDRNRLVSEEGLARAQVVVFGRALEDLSNNALRLMDAAAVIPEAFERVRFASSQLEELLVDELVESTGEVGFQLGYFGNSVRVLADATNRVAKSMQVDAQLVTAETRGVATILNARAQIGTQTPVDVYANNFDVYREAISSLNYQFYEGGLSAEELNRRVSVLASNMETLTGISGEGVDSLGALQSALSRGVEAFYYSQEAIEQREAERADLERRRLEGLYSSGLSSLRYYFDELEKISGEMTVAAEAAEPALVATEEALGRLTSAAYVFGESVKAVEDGLAFYQTAEQQREFGGNVQAARAVAAAAQQLADIVTTRSGFEAQQALSGEAAFAETESTALRDISRLVESVSAFDAAGLERAFVRASVALKDGTITLDQYTALIDYSQGVYLGASSALEDLAGSAANLEAIAREREGLERQLLELQGDTAAIRALERAELFEANRELYDRINALRDEQAATEAAAQALEAITREREGLEGRLLQLQGNTAALRARELAALDVSNRALQEQIYALEDQAAAAEAAAQASAEAARKIEEEQQLRAQLLDQINALRVEAQQEVESARSGVTSAIDALAEASERAAQGLMEAQRAVATGIGEYLRELRGTTAGSGNAFERRDYNAGQFASLSARALSGDLEAAQGIVGAAQAYLGSVRETAGSSLEIAREEGRVRAQLLAVQALNAVGTEEQTDALGEAQDAQQAYTSAVEAAAAAGIVYTRSMLSGAEAVNAAIEAFKRAQGVASDVGAPMAELSLLDRFRLLNQQLSESEARELAARSAMSGATASGAQVRAKQAELFGGGSVAAPVQSVAPGQTFFDADAGRFLSLTGQLNEVGGAITQAADITTASAAAIQAAISYYQSAAAYDALTSGSGSLDFYAAKIAEAQSYLPAFAAGGSYRGGMALVGEEGPELINFSSPGQVYTATQTREALGTDTRKLEALVVSLTKEVAGLKTELRDISRSTDQTASQLRRVIRDDKLIVGEEVDA